MKTESGTNGLYRAIQMRKKCLPVAGETADQPAVRLQQLRAAESKRLATETVEDKEAKLPHDRTS